MKVAKEAISAAQWRDLEQDVVSVVRTGEACLRLTGTGRVACLQGLVTCDIGTGEANTHHIGGLLTNKGMVIALLRITMLEDDILVTLPRSALAEVSEILTKSLPPRLCRFEELGAAIAGFYGPQAAAALEISLPEPGQVVVRKDADETTVYCRSRARGVGGIDMLFWPAAFGIVPGWQANREDPRAMLEACRIFAGVPSLDSEVDGKTLPQEIRFDELGAVSYTKGCYLGQETVARVHFRGHPNRRLVMLVLDDEPAVLPVPVHAGEKNVGRLTSAAWSPELDAWVGQAVLRREVEDGAEVKAGEVGAVVRVERWLRAP